VQQPSADSADGCGHLRAPHGEKNAGRLNREHTHKAKVRIIDFVDTGHPALLRMWEKRQRGYRAMGYRMAE